MTRAEKSQKLLVAFIYSFGTCYATEVSNCKKDRAEQNNTHDQGDQSTSSHADFNYYRYATGKRLAYIAGIPASNRPIRSKNIIFELLLPFYYLDRKGDGRSNRRS